MGVVIRQGIKQSVFTYLGVLIGAVNVLFIYPLALDKAELGLLRFIIDTGTLLMPLMLVGANQLSVRFFPYFKTENSNRHNGLLSFLLLIILLASSIVCLILYCFKNPIYHFYTQQSELYEPVLHYVIPIAVLTASFSAFTGFAQNFKRIAIPVAFNLLYIKIGVPLLALAYYYQFIQLDQIFIGVIVVYLIINISHYLYLKFLQQWNLNLDFRQFISIGKLKEIMEFSFYAMVGNIGSIIVVRIDSFMVASLASLADNGVYTISAFIANAIATPTNAISAIATPLISDFWKTNNTEQIKVLYQKSSLNLMIAGCWLFACICIGLEYLFQLMPKGEEYEAGTMVILILGASKLFDMATSINNPIIAMSKNYKFNFYALISLAILNIFGNYLLIDEYGILGAAISSFIALFLFNILKLFYIWWKFDMQPFTKATIYLIAFIGIAYLLAFIIPELNNPFLNLVLKCGTITIIFGTLVLGTGISEDVNRIVKNVFK